MKKVFIVSAKRTPVGGFLGSLSILTSVQLGSIAIRDIYQSLNLDPGAIDSVYMGNVLSAGLGQSPARQASLSAGIHLAADCTTINKVCAFGLKAVIIGAQQIQLGLEAIALTGGMESLSNAPHYISYRGGRKPGDAEVVDGLLKDGLTDAFDGYHMSNAAELCAKECNISRNEQDEYALESYSRAEKATSEGKFNREIIPIAFTHKSSEVIFKHNEDTGRIIPENVANLSAVFDEQGTITAANASNLNDGEAAVLLASKEAVQKHALEPLAKIISYADAAQAPEWFTTSPSIAIPKALKQADLTKDGIDFFEINEAYAAVAIANQRLLKLRNDKVNPYGGAIALGHPLGASGARILCTLLSVLKQEGGRYGVAAICKGGGGASAMVVENLN
ncbi:MAG TPA: acetyl-CoA C-acyltransferase [Flavisolibacter sp.]|nr:acetyl-CoA C-acyltransferase [Flavisolibacter sp.]